MKLSDVPVFPGVVHPEGAPIVVTGKAGGAIAVGAPVTSTDGTTWTADTGAPADLAGVAAFDARKETDGFVLDDVITVIVFGMVSVKANAAIVAGSFIIGAAAGKVAPAATAVTALGKALSDAAADNDIIWALIDKQAEDLAAV